MSQCSFPKGPYHGDPVSFSRAGGSKNHVWICVACRTQLSGPRLPDDERNALVEFALVMRKQFAERSATTSQRKGNNMAKQTQTDATAPKAPRLEIAVLAGAESKAWLAQFAELVGRLEKVSGKLTTAPAADDDADDASDDVDTDAEGEETETTDDDDGDFGAEAGEDDTAEDDFDEPAPKKKAAAKETKAAKLTAKDVNAACKERAGRTNRADVLGILKKKFKVTSVTELKPEQYADVIKTMKGK